MSSWKSHEDEILIQSKLYLDLSYGKIADILKDRTRNAVRHRWDVLKKSLNKTEVQKQNSKPKILIFDIETSPLIVYSWGVYQQYINPDNVIKDWFVISWAAKWLGEDKVYSGVVTPKEVSNSDDKRIVSELWKLLDEADIVVAHNCDKFDKKKLNWRFLIHGFPPPLQYKTVDTLKVARKYFSATSNKLDYLTRSLSLGDKSETGGFELWSSCLEGNTNSLSKMLEYNINDIVILESIYNILLPWITNHPNLGLYDDREINICPACGSDQVEIVEKKSTTSVNAYYQYRCKNCNHVGRTKEYATTKEKRQAVLSN